MTDISDKYQGVLASIGLLNAVKKPVKKTASKPNNDAAREQADKEDTAKLEGWAKGKGMKKLLAAKHGHILSKKTSRGTTSVFHVTHAGGHIWAHPLGTHKDEASAKVHPTVQKAAGLCDDMKNSLAPILMYAREKLMNSGTSEGVKKGWESRRNAGWNNWGGSHSKDTQYPPIASTSSGKAIEHPNHKVYTMDERRRGWTSQITPLSDVREGGKILRERLSEDGWTKKDHEEAAQAHLDAAKTQNEKWSKTADEAAMAAFGRKYEPTDYRISGIASDQFSDAHKNALRDAARQGGGHVDAAFAHWVAAGHRNLEPMREARRTGDRIKNSNTNVDAVLNSGTPEGVKKAWETRKAGIQNPNSSTQGFDPTHANNPYHDTLLKHGYAYSHSTPVNKGEGGSVYHTYKHGELKDNVVGIEDTGGIPEWRAHRLGSAHGTNGYGKGQLDRFLTGHVERAKKLERESLNRQYLQEQGRQEFHNSKAADIIKLLREKMVNRDNYITGTTVELTGQKISNSAFKLPDDGWFHVASLGEHPHKSTGLVQVIDNAACEAMVKNFNAKKSDPNFPGLLIDTDHKSQIENTSEASGWIDGLQARDTGLWAHPRWTDTGEAQVTNGRYRLVSPVWERAACENLGNNRVRPLVLDSVGLTNTPNLQGLQPITNSGVTV